MKEQNIPYKIYLTEEELPQAWYNLRADMINKPPHYNQGGIECIDAIAAAVTGLEGMEAVCTGINLCLGFVVTVRQVCEC